MSDGWFVVNVREAEWWFTEGRGGLCGFENEYGPSPVEFPELGFRLAVLHGGERSLYHAEANQEAFLVLEGECRLLVEGEERALGRWDFFYCPPWTEHAFVGAGEAPCVLLMVGARRSPDVRYPAAEIAARYDAGVDHDTSDWREAYADNRAIPARAPGVLVPPPLGVTRHRPDRARFGRRAEAPVRTRPAATTKLRESPDERADGAARECELLDHAADLAAQSATLTHENQRRWRVFRERVDRLTAP